MGDSRRVRTCYRIGTVPVTVTGRVIRCELGVARRHLVQRRNGTQLVVRRFVVALFRVQHRNLLADALFHLTDAVRARRVAGDHTARTTIRLIVAAQRQSPDAPVEIVRTLAL